MKKVLLVSASYPDKYHHWAAWNKNISVAISKLGDTEIEVVVPRPMALPFKWFPHHEICSLPLVEREEEGIVHYPRFLYLLPKNIFYGATGEFYRYSVAKYILNHIKNTDLVHARFAYMDGYGMLGLCTKWHVPLIVDIHGENTFEVFLKNSLINKKIMKTFQYSKKIVCVSKNIYSMAKNFGIEEEKLEYIPLGVDVDKFKPGDKDAIRQRLGIDSQKVVLFVGALIERKGVRYLLKAIATIDPSLLADTKFVVVGDGDQKNELIELSEKLRIRDKVLFTGPVTDDDLVSWYSLADLFVLPSLSEGRPVAIYEAMASGCAIIATDVSGIPEQVIPEYNGFLVKPRDPGTLSDNLAYLLQNEGELERMGKNSRDMVIHEGWTWERYADKMNKVYGTVLG